MDEKIIILGATVCSQCHLPFSTYAKKRTKCPRCGKSTKINPYFRSDDAEKVAEAVRLKILTPDEGEIGFHPAKN